MCVHGKLKDNGKLPIMRRKKDAEGSPDPDNDGGHKKRKPEPPAGPPPGTVGYRPSHGLVLLSKK